MALREEYTKNISLQIGDQLVWLELNTSGGYEKVWNIPWSQGENLRRELRGPTKKKMEMIEEMIEDDAREDQPDNPTQPEPEVEVIVGNQPEKPSQDSEREQQAGDTIENPQDKATPTEGVKMDNMMRMMMEQFGQIKENNKKQRK